MGQIKICVHVFNDQFIANLPLNVAVKKVLKNGPIISEDIDRCFLTHGVG